MIFRFTRALAVASSLLIISTPAWAQSEGTLTGVVRDATNAGSPGATVAATSQPARDERTATTGPDGSYSLSLPAGTYAVAITLPGFRRVTQTVDITAGGSRQLDATLDAVLAEAVTVTATKREQTLLDVPFSVAAPTGETLRLRGVRRPRGHRGERRRTDRAEPRARSEPGGDPRRIGRADRARSAGREGTGRRLPRRVGRLAVALHAGSRSVRRQPRGSAARSAGDAVRLGLADRHRALHHQPAGEERHEGLRGVRSEVRQRRGRGRRREGRVQRTARHEGRRARGRVSRPHRGIHRRGAARRRRPRGRQRRVPDRFPRRRQAGAERPRLDHAARGLPAGGDEWMEPRRRVQHRRESLHDHAAGGDARRAGAVHAAPGDLRRRLRARRRQLDVPVRR